MSDCEVHVLTSRPYVPGEPTWSVADRPSTLVDALGAGGSGFPLIVLDVPGDLPPYVRPLVERLRHDGVGLVRYVLGGDPTDEDLATWLGELGHPSVLDLAAAVAPARIMELLERGEPVGSVAGRALTPEMLTALAVDLEENREPAGR
jgi:hypothetical protein